MNLSIAIPDSSLATEPIIPSHQGNADTEAILQEAQNVLEGKIRTTMPEPPTATSENFSKSKEAMI